MRKKIAVLILLVFSVVIIPFVYNDVYYIPQILIMFIAPFLLLGEGINKNDIIPLLLILSILLTRITHPESFRLSSVGYSVLFVTTYIYYTKVLNKSGLSIVEFQRLIKGIIIAYGIVLIIQISFRLVGFQPINASYNTEEGIKFNSLSFEASQIGPVITLLMYAYMKVEELVRGKRMRLKDLFCKNIKWVFFFYVITSLLSFSVTTYFALIVFLSYFLSKRHLVPGVVALLVCVIIFFSLGTEVGNRIIDILQVIPSKDVREIYSADASASARIVPFLVFFQDFDVLSINTWLGYGCDYGNLHIWRILVGDDFAENSLAVIGLFGFIYDYGLIAFSFFLLLIHSLCKFRSFPFFLFITCFFLVGFNMAPTWLFFMIIYTINLLNKQYENSNLYNNRNI